MDISSGTLQTITQNVNVSFKDGLNQAKESAKWRMLAAEIPSSASREIYLLSGDAPVMREWIGGRVASEVAKKDWVIKNRTWEGSVKIKREMIEDDNFGLLKDDSVNLGVNAGNHPDKLIFALLKLGFTTLGYDGQYFFDTDHPNGKGGSGTFNNKGTTALSADAAGIAAVVAARHAAALITTDSGEPLDIDLDVIVVPKALKEVATILATNPTIYTGGTTATTNPLAGTMTVISSGRLDVDSTTNWYMFASKAPRKPFAFQMRRPPRLTAKISPDDDNVFNRNEFIWGADYRGNAGYLMPQFAFGASV